MFIIFFSDVTCVGHWPMVAHSFDYVRIQSISSNHETSNHPENLTESSTKSNPVPILPNLPTYLIVQERSGLARSLLSNTINPKSQTVLQTRQYNQSNLTFWILPQYCIDLCFRCVEYSRISGEDRPKLSVKIFEAECNENVWMARADLVYQVTML